MRNKATIEVLNNVTFWRRDGNVQYCPWCLDADPGSGRCGSWCPMFCVGRDPTIKRMMVYVECCGHDTLMFDVEEEDANA